MEDRFIQFSVEVSKLNKQIQKLKTQGMQLFDMKAVHTLCLYQLMLHPNGMHFSQLAETCDLDSALVSRILSKLTANGTVRKEGAPGKYNAQYFLTDKGIAVGEQIRGIVHSIQDEADRNIEKEDLMTFYRVLHQLLENFENMIRAGMAEGEFYERSINC